jgi:iron complex outermembrane receptor protein
MRLIFGGAVTAFLTFIFCFSYAQPKPPAIRGTVFLQDGIVAEAATVILLKQADSSVVSSALVNSKGAYELVGIKPGTYLILVTRLGYEKSYSSSYSISRIDITIAPIRLKPLNTQLKEVAVIAKTPFIEVKPGKIVINPQASITADGKSALDILKQSPGVKVDNSDNISITGRQHALILIDGKTTNLSGADLASLLKSTQGNTVERMEVISGGSAKYDAAAGGIINIVLKKGKNIGSNGTFSAGLGNGRFYKSNAGISFNNRTEHVNIYGSYNYTNNKTYRDIFNDRAIDNTATTGLLSNYNSSYRNTQKSITNNYRAGADFFLSPKHTIGVLVYGFANSYDFEKRNRLDILNQGNLDSVITAASTIDRNLRSTNYNLNYSGTLDEAGKTLSASVTYSPYSRHNDEYINNDFYSAAGARYRNSWQLQNLSPSKRSNWTGMVDFASPLSKTAKLETGLKFSHSKSDNNLVFGPMLNGIYTVDSTFSNNFIYTEDVAAAYVNYNSTFGKFDLESGVRGEYTHSRGYSVSLNRTVPYNYFNLFPTVLLNYHYNDKNDYAISFTRGLDRPNYDNLNPFLIYVDPYNYQSGNPFLRPEYTNTLKLTHTYNKDITTALYASLLTNGNFTYYQQNNSNGINILTRRNLGRAYIYGINFNAPVNFTSWWTAQFNADYSYQRYTVYPQYGNFSKASGYFVGTSTQSFTISKTIAAEVSGRYESSTVYGIVEFQPIYLINAGISKQLFNKLGKLTLNFNDIFNTSRDRAFTDYQNLNLRVYDKTETQYIRLNFTYRFGKTTVKNAKRHSTGNEGEQTRMNRQ